MHFENAVPSPTSGIIRMNSYIILPDIWVIFSFFKIQDEMDLIHGKGFCKEFRRKWTALVPLILKYTKKNPKPNSEKVLEYYPDLSTCKGKGGY